jgi:1-acyl-sn-glycerol-3-phosphate acyltransferase
LLKEVKAKKGKKVVIFPEGTRSLTGEIQTFEAGAKIVAEKLALKVQPIVIKDLRNYYSESEKYSKRGTVHIEILPAVELKEGWYENCRTDMIAAKKVI